MSRGDPPASPAAAMRLARLDGLRGLAACMVAFPYHAQFLFAPGQFSGAGPLVGWLHQFGWAFVDLFFVLSGYIFAHVYLAGDTLRSRSALAEFAVARVARLYPLHLLILLLLVPFVFGRPGNGWAQLAANLAMLQVFARPFAESFNGPSWSLSIEVFCYLLFAAGAYAGRRALLAVTVAMVALNAWRLGWHGAPGGPYVAEVIPRGLLGFFLGQLLWHARAPLARLPAPVLVLLLGMGIAATALPVSPVLGLALLAWPAALLLALRLPLMGGATMVWLGDRSYGIYLIHMPVIMALQAMLGTVSTSGWLALGLHLLVAGATLVLATLSLRLVENPARRAIRSWWQRRTAARAEGACQAAG